MQSLLLHGLKFFESVKLGKAAIKDAILIVGGNYL